jgi:hypothetical protein
MKQTFGRVQVRVLYIVLYLKAILLAGAFRFEIRDTRRYSATGITHVSLDCSGRRGVHTLGRP